MTDRRSDRFGEKGEYESKKKAKRGSKDESGEKDIKTDGRGRRGVKKERDERPRGRKRELVERETKRSRKGRREDTESEIEILRQEGGLSVI